jgi:hypothetical protein
MGYAMAAMATLAVNLRRNEWLRMTSLGEIREADIAATPLAGSHPRGWLTELSITRLYEPWDSLQ